MSNAYRESSLLFPCISIVISSECFIMISVIEFLTNLLVIPSTQNV